MGLTSSPLRLSASPTAILPSRLSLLGVLLKFTFIIFSVENLSFGHSVAICSLYGAYAYLLTSNLRLSLKISPSDIFFASSHFFVGPYPAAHHNTKKAAFRRPLVLLERAMGFGPTTSTLARLRSTPELYPHQCNFKNIDFCLNVIQ